MFKYIAHIKKKVGMSRQDFIDYYENKHEPLIRSLLPHLHIYRRNYLVFDDPLINVDGRGGGSESAGYDVLTEGVLGSREEAEAFFAAFANPEIFSKIQADEANFVAPGSVKVYVVEVHQSKIP